MAAGQSVTLRPSILNLLLYSGDGFSVRIACKDPSGAPLDITGSVKAQIRPDRVHSGDPALADFTASLVDAYQGFVTLSLTGAQTAGLMEEGQTKFIGVWDVEWHPVGKEPRTIVQGDVECIADVTR